MAHKITSATYGRSEAGLKTLKSNLQGDCSRMVSALNGAEYTNLVNSIKKYWAGVDADDWLKDLETKTKTLTSNIKSVSSKAQGYLDQDLASFKSFQARNVTK